MASSVFDQLEAQRGTFHPRTDAEFIDGGLFAAYDEPHAPTNDGAAVLPWRKSHTGHTLQEGLDQQRGSSSSWQYQQHSSVRHTLQEGLQQPRAARGSASSSSWQHQQTSIVPQLSGFEDAAASGASPAGPSSSWQHSHHSHLFASSASTSLQSSFEQPSFNLNPFPTASAVIERVDAAVGDQGKNNEPSLGSALHRRETCTPCKFFRGRRGCKEGKKCKLCHYPHEELTYSGIRMVMHRKAIEKRRFLESEAAPGANFQVQQLPPSPARRPPTRSSAPAGYPQNFNAGHHAAWPQRVDSQEYVGYVGGAPQGAINVPLAAGCQGHVPNGEASAPWRHYGGASSFALSAGGYSRFQQGQAAPMAHYGGPEVPFGTVSIQQPWDISCSSMPSTTGPNSLQCFAPDGMRWSF